MIKMQSFFHNLKIEIIVFPEDIGYASHDNTCIKEVMSRTRKRIRQYNDHLDDLGLKDADGRPCKKCKESILRECQALVKELQRAKDQFQESSMKNKFPCDCKDIS